MKANQMNTQEYIWFGFWLDSKKLDYKWRKNHSKSHSLYLTNISYIGHPKRVG